MFPTTISTAFLTIAIAFAASACGSPSSDRKAQAASAPAPSTASSQADIPQRPNGSVDKLVRIETGRLHLHCEGEGPNTVLLIAGWGDGGDESWKVVQPAIAGDARVCTYDRFGTGTSDAPAADQTFTTEANDLHTLLEEAAEPGPYVVVGHSFGGAEAVTFASRYRDEVAGLMLVDASPATWPAAVCAVPDDGTDGAQTARTLCAVFHDPALDAERLDVVSAFDEVAAIDSLDDLPVTVVTAAHRTWPGLTDAALTRLDAVWAEGVSRWTALSPNATTVTVEESGHYIQIEHPDVVVNALTQLMSASDA